MVSFRPQIWVFLTKNRCFWVIFHFWRHFHLHIESEFSGKRFEKLKLRSTRWILRNFRIFGGMGVVGGSKKIFFEKKFFWPPFYPHTPPKNRKLRRIYLVDRNLSFSKRFPENSDSICRWKWRQKWKMTQKHLFLVKNTHIWRRNDGGGVTVIWVW